MTDQPVYGWLHVATIGRWEPILRALLDAIDRSGLRSASSRIQAGVVGPDADLSWLPSWVEIVRRDGKLELGECSTLEALWDWSKTTAGPGKVWYAHTKGVSHPPDSKTVAYVDAWRDMLVYFNI